MLSACIVAVLSIGISGLDKPWMDRTLSVDARVVRRPLPHTPFHPAASSRPVNPNVVPHDDQDKLLSAMTNQEKNAQLTYGRQARSGGGAYIIISHGSMGVGCGMACIIISHGVGCGLWGGLRGVVRHRSHLRRPYHCRLHDPCRQPPPLPPYYCRHKASSRRIHVSLAHDLRRPEPLRDWWNRVRVASCGVCRILAGDTDRLEGRITHLCTGYDDM